MCRKLSNRTPAVFSPSSFPPPKIFTKEQSQYLVRYEFDQILCTSSSWTVVSKMSLSIQCDPTPVLRRIYTQRMINFVQSFKINANFSADEVGKNYYLTFSRPASWSSGQSFWLLTMRSRVRFRALPWECFLIGGGSPWWPRSGYLVEFRLKVETSVMRSHNSINSDWIHDRDLAGGDLTTRDS